MEYRTARDNICFNSQRPLPELLVSGSCIFFTSPLFFFLQFSVPLNCFVSSFCSPAFCFLLYSGECKTLLIHLGAASTVCNPPHPPSFSLFLLVSGFLSIRDRPCFSSCRLPLTSLCLLQVWRQWRRRPSSIHGVVAVVRVGPQHNTRAEGQTRLAITYRQHARYNLHSVTTLWGCTDITCMDSYLRMFAMCLAS